MPHLKDKNGKYIHRDLSWLDFNERVLEEAEDMSNPLMERLKFLAIFFNNLDEFFMVRLASCLRLVSAEYHTKDRYGWYPNALASAIYKRAQILTNRAYAFYNKKCLKELAQENIFIKRYQELSNEQKRFANNYFEDSLYSVLTPIAVDHGRPFPLLSSKTLVIGVSVRRYGKDNFCVIPIPHNVSRLVHLPSEADAYAFCLIEDIIVANIKRFFKGYTIVDLAIFRIIRDSEFTDEEEMNENLLKMVEKEVKKRFRAQVVNIAVAQECSHSLRALFCEKMDFLESEVSVISGELDLTFLFELVKNVPKSELFYDTYVPQQYKVDNIFDRIKEHDILVHLPYESFKITEDLLMAAAQDPNVLLIKMTLYRLDEHSAIVRALKLAVQNKKQVTVLVEIKARFDEERNIRWVRELEEAGCHVIYGIVNMKIHSKITLIVRREDDKIKRYVHLSTGNYNSKTAALYTDIGYFTANDDVARDISDIFNVITGCSVPSRWARVISSPNDLRGYFADLIDNEIAFQKKNGNGFIFAKMNSLEDVGIIDKLYQASMAGVRIKLIVRGICVLRPGVKGMSETIEVRSIVGRFLEHSRVFMFNNNGNQRFFMSSADWMRRNFDHRIELVCEITMQELKERIRFLLDLYWKDNQKARTLTAEDTYVRIHPEGERLNAQDFLMKHYSL
jgi:polyphosphate kinase